MYKIKSKKAKKAYLPLLIYFLLFIVVNIQACKEEDNPTGNNNPPLANEVLMQNNRFSPGTLTVSAGTTVKWTNRDNATHNVISATFSSSDMNQNTEFTHTFSTAGTFTYSCTHHSGMTGTIVVQ